MNAGARDLPNTPNERSRRQGYSAGWSLNTLSVTNEGHLAGREETADESTPDRPTGRMLAANDVNLAELALSWSLE